MKSENKPIASLEFRHRIISFGKDFVLVFNSIQTLTKYFFVDTWAFPALLALAFFYIISCFKFNSFNISQASFFLLCIDITKICGFTLIVI